MENIVNSLSNRFYKLNDDCLVSMKKRHLANHKVSRSSGSYAEKRVKNDVFRAIEPLQKVPCRHS